MHFELFSIMIYLHFFVYVDSYFVQNKLIQNKNSDNNPNRWSNVNVRHYSIRLNNFKFLKIMYKSFLLCAFKSCKINLCGNNLR
jgi:hypothetical protein